MNQPDFWTSYAEAMELSVEGNRLIAQEVTTLLGRLWNRILRTLDAAIHSVGQQGHLPPV
jgi:hypothetical protein